MAAVSPNPSGRPSARQIIGEAFDRLRIPPLAQRAALGVLVFLGIYIALVALPSYMLELLQSRSIPVSVSVTALTYYGGALAVLGAASYVTRPYRAYGPVAMATDGAELLYLYVFYQASPLRFSLGNGSGSGAFAIGYGVVLLILMVVVLFSLAADAVVTYEDFTRPAERLYYSYPAR